MLLNTCLNKEQKTGKAEGGVVAMRKYRLLSPGPTPVPEKVLLKMADTIIHHRTPQFQAVIKDVNKKLKDSAILKNGQMHHFAHRQGGR